MLSAAQVGAERPDAPRASPPSCDESHASRRRTIVYVEDNPANVALMHGVVEDLDGFELLAAPTAEAGIDLILRQRPDLVLMDINLPGMSGTEAMRRLRQWSETEKVPVIALTAAVMADQQAQTIEAGFHRCLTKPVDIDELVSILRALP